MKTKIRMWALPMLLVMLVSVVAVSATPINTGNDETLSVYKTTGLSNPITLNDLIEMRGSVMDSCPQNTRIDMPRVLADPEVPEGAKIVAYGFTIDAHGVPVQYVGLAGDEKSVSIIQKKAQEWKTANIIDPQDAVIKETETLDRSGWIEVGRNTADYYLDPYGGVTNNYELRKLSNDGDGTKDWFAIKQIFAMEPGSQVYESSWTNNMGTMLHDWAAGTFGNAQLYEWDPIGSHSGSQTIGISITGGTGDASASWSWSYSQPEVSTYDQSSTGTDKAKWEMEFNNDASKKTTGGMKPGSTCSVNQHSSGTYKILDLKADGQFFNGLLTYHTLSDTWNIKYQY